MIRNYIISSIRNLLKHKIFSIVSILGFSIGIATAILIIFWIFFELSYDKFHLNSNRIYRVVAEFDKQGKPDHFARTPAPLGLAMKNNFPEVENFTRLGYFGKDLVCYNQKQFWEEICTADPTILTVFSISLLKGNSVIALSDPGNIVISERIAEKYFGDEDPLGKSLRVGKNDNQTFIVTGVMKNVPQNSQFQFDMLVPFSIRKSHISWGHWNYTTYVLLSKNCDPKLLENKLPGFFKKYEQGNSNTKLHLQAFSKIHLYSKLRSDFASNINISKLILYATIGFLILALGSINYINMMLARSTLRNKEIGIRKVIGATGKQLKLQFLSESISITLFSFLVAIPLIYLLLPVFNEFISKELIIAEIINMRSVAIIFGLLLIISFINGLYPAFILTSLKPVAAFIKNHNSNDKHFPSFNKALVAIQFAIAVFFISCSLVVKKQLFFMNNKSLGYNSDHIIVLPIFYNEVNKKYETLKSELTKNPAISNVTATSFLPTERRFNQNAWWESPDNTIVNGRMSWMGVDFDFIETLDIKLIKGNDFSRTIRSNYQGEYIVNKRAVEMTGWQNPIGKQINVVNMGRVIGVVDDFHFESLHSNVEPLALYIYHDVYRYLFIKTNAGQIASILKFAEKKWKELFPNRVFEYSFLNNELGEIYEKEIKEGRVFNFISFLSLLIAGLGIFGFSSLSINKRTKEIGIRKMNGAKTMEILLLLNKKFLIWVSIAFVVSYPIAYLLMNKWLSNFAYKTEMSWWIFALAGFITLVIALITVSWQSWQAASRNPVEALRYE